MSLLAPLYFAGALAIGLPILFHLIRRQPRGEVQFSSLMFLQPTPPRLTRRSRLDNWPLLLIRALALLLMAAAFTRPFFRSVSMLESDLPTRRWVIVLDTSASMRRDGLWEQAQSHVDEILDDLRPGDEVAVMTFDNEPNPLLSFEQTSALTTDQTRSSIKKLLVEKMPSWAGTDLGRAISFAADLAITFEPEARDADIIASTNSTSPDADSVQKTNASPKTSGPAQLFLITDMQAGSHLESLQVYAWPDQLSIDIRPVRTDRRTNASAQLLPVRENSMQDERSSDKDRVRVRVSNSGDADQTSFRVAWASASGEPIANTELPVQVPAGESRVVRMPAPTPGVSSLTLQGDDHDFDNDWYIVSPQPASLTLLHLGPSAGNAGAGDPRDSLLYYLQRVPLDTLQRTVTTECRSPNQFLETPDPKDVPFIVLSQPCSAETSKLLREYVKTGGQLLYVLSDPQNVNQDEATLRSLTETMELRASEANVDDYVMLSRIDFGHPVFAPMSDPQFNDFKKIRFWSHRSIANVPDSWDVLARFDDEDPALLEHTIGEGKLWVLAAGWQPSASQLALSTKFIPLIDSLFDSDARSSNGGNQYSVGETTSLSPSPTAEITLPSGNTIAYQNVSDLPTLNQPGIYAMSDDDSTTHLAVNLAVAESQTETIEADSLERFGISMGTTLSTAEELTNQRQLRDRELESRQRMWQWLLVSALGLLGLETFLGGLLSRARPSQTEAMPA